MQQLEPVRLAIKNMVCNRCIRVVKEELENLGLEVKDVSLGSATVSFPEKNIAIEQVRETLEKAGFGLLEDKKAQQIEQIKALVLKLVADPESKTANYSELIAKSIGRDYHYLSQLFSSSENVTIEKYVILQKIERVKEWLVYDELSLSQMADTLGYSSVAHLSSQFKQVTGFTPTAFKNLKNHHRQSLDQIG